jgi:hypothetical protein
MGYRTVAVVAAAATLLAAPSATARNLDRNGPSSHRAVGQTDLPAIGRRWREPDWYQPCPADVVLGSGRHACLGLPD